MKCPCCGNDVEHPSLDVVIDVYKLSQQEAAILRAVWRGKGHAVHREKIYDEMYAYRLDGGPSENRMYINFKSRLCLLRKKLRGSGVWIETTGYMAGYRLVIGEKAKQAEKENEHGA